MKTSIINKHSYKALLEVQQSRYQWFNFWLLLLSQISLAVVSFPFYGYPFSQPIRFPIFISIQLFLVIGWHFIFVIISKSMGRLWKPLSQIPNLFESLLATTIFVMECYLLLAYRCVFSSIICSTILSTSARESSEFLDNITNMQIAITSTSLLIIIIISYTLAQRKCTSTTLQDFSIWKYISAITLVGVVSYSIMNGVRAKVGNTPPGIAASGIDRTLWGTYVSVQAKAQLGDRIERLLSPKHLEGTTIKATFADPVDIVVILGETARADFLSAYGFKHSTTPVLDSLITEGDAFCFNDARCAANSTIESSKRIFTLWNDRPGLEWCDFPNLMSCFSRAGYRTIWYTNQETEGPFSVERMFGKTVDLLRTPYGKSGGVVTRVGFDEEILPVIGKFNDSLQIRQPEKKSGQLSIIHLMGSHYQYSLRYPSRFNRFKKEDVIRKNGSTANAKVAEYMNSILYTDYVLGAIYALYRERPALIVYLSDHGESLYDSPDQPDLCGHGGRPTLEQADIPFVVMLTPSFRKSYPALSKRIYDSRFRPISTAWLTNTLTLTAGIRTRYSDDRYDFFGEKFNPPTQRATQGEGGKASYPPVKIKRVK